MGIIYKLNFNGTDKVYIGQTVNLDSRWRSYMYLYKKGALPKKLQEAFDTYGKPCMEVLEEVKEGTKLSDREIYWIDKYRSKDQGFNTRGGGPCGAGLTGELNGRAMYSNKQVLDAAELIAYSDLSYKDIAKSTGISLQGVSQIAIGARHAWVKTEFPELWEDILNSKRVIGTKFITSNTIVNIETGEEHYINSVEEAQKITGCQVYSTMISFLNGRNQTLYNKWELKHKVAKKVKVKPTYILYNEALDIVEEVNSVLKFVNTYGIVNRRKFSEFLKASEVDSIYQGWNYLGVK